MGLRISWLIVATKRLLALFAASARSFSSRRERIARRAAT